MIVRELINLIGFKVNNAQLKRAELGVDSLQKKMQSFGIKSSMLVTAPFIALNVWIGKTLSDFEQLDVSFETMLGSAEKAEKLVHDMLQFAVDTPFEIKDIGPVTKQLLATGSTAEGVINDLRILGNAAAGAGVPMSRLALNFGQVRAQGKLTGREMRDFAVAGINMRKIIGDILGVNEELVASMVSQGKIGFDLVAKAFEKMSAKGGIYHNLMIKQARTLGGLWSRFKDLITLSVRDYSKSLLPMFKSIVLFFIKILDFFKEGLTPTMKKTIFILGGLAAAIGPLVLAFAALIKIGLFVQSALLAVATAARVANLSTSLFLLKFALIGVAVLAAVALSVALFEDITMFMKGSDSLIGRIIKRLDALNSKLKEMGIFSLQSLKEILKSMSSLIDNFMEFIVGIFMGKWRFVLDSMKNGFVNLFKTIGDLMLAFVQPVLDIMNKITGSKHNITGALNTPDFEKFLMQGLQAQGAPGMGASASFNTNVNLTLPNDPSPEQMEAVGSGVQSAVSEAMKRASRDLVTAMPELE